MERARCNTGFYSRQGILNNVKSFNWGAQAHQLMVSPFLVFYDSDSKSLWSQSKLDGIITGFTGYVI